MHFIELHDKNGNAIVINFDWVLTIQKNENGGCCIWTNDGCYNVKESLETVKECVCQMMVYR